VGERAAGFDIVVAVTEDTVNFQFEQLFRQRLIPDTLKVELADTGLAIDATLSAPMISIAPSGATGTVLFLVRMARGTFHYYEGFGPSARSRKIAIDDWTYAFRVTMNFAELDRTLGRAALPESVRRSLEAFDDEQFTVRQLLLDFENADLADFDPAHTSMPLPDGKKPSPNLLAQWQNALSDYFRSLKGTAHPYVLGYTVRDRDGVAHQDVPALLNPSGGTCSTYRNPSSAGLSTLNFLLAARGVTDDKLPPVPPNGVFAEPLCTDEAYDGVMLVDADVFRTGYLEPVLLPAIAGATGMEGFRRRAYHGQGRALAWEAVDDVSDLGRVVLDLGAFNVYQDHTDHQECSVSVTPGNTIALRGAYRTEYKWYGKPVGVETELSRVAVSREWTAALAFGAGSDGRLTLTLSSFDPGESHVERAENALERLVDLIDSSVREGERQFAVFLGRIEAGLADRVRANLASSLAALADRVVLPGGDVFFYAGGALDDELNLRCTLQYKAVRSVAGATLAAGAGLSVASTAELMTNHEPGRVLDPQRRFGVFQDAAGEPAMLSIGTDDVFRLVHRDGSSATGWSERTLAAAVAGGARPTAFEVGQGADGRLRLAVAFDAGSSTRLYVTPPLGNDLAAADWRDLEKSWVPRPAPEPVGSVTGITMGVPDGRTAPLTIVATEQDGRAYHWIVDADPGSTARIWQRYVLPENATTLIDLSIGVVDGNRGVYALYDLAGGERRLEFTSLPDPKYHKTLNYAFDLPARVERIEALDGGLGSTDLFAAGDGVYVFSRSARTASTVAPAGTVRDVTALLARADGTHVSVFAVAGDDQLWYAGGNTGPDAAWPAPVLIGQQCARIAALRSRVWLNNHVMVARPDGSPGYLWQDPGTGLWRDATVALPDTGTVVTYPSYTTQISLTRADGLPGAGGMVTVATSTLATVVVNGGQHRTGPQRAAAVTADAHGRLTVVSRACSLSSPRLTIAGDGLAPVTVRPAQPVLDGLAALRTADDLTGARLRSGPRAGQPVLTGRPDPALLTGVAYVIGRLCGLPEGAPSDCYGFRAQAEQSAVLLRDDARRVLDGLTEAVTGNPGDLLRHLRQTAEPVRTLLVDVDAAVTSLVVEAQHAVYRFALDTTEHLLEAVNWLLEVVLGLSLDDLVNWFGFGFAWQDIKRTHRVMRQLTNWTLEYLTGQADDFAGRVETWFDGVKRQLRDPAAVASLGRLAKPRARAEQDHATLDDRGTAVLSALRGSPSGSWVQHHLAAGGLADRPFGRQSRAEEPIAALLDEVLVPELASLERTFGKIGADVGRAWSGDLGPAELVALIGVDVLVGLLDLVEKLIAGLLRVLGDVVEDLRADLDEPIEVPVIGALYRAFVGDRLSVLDVGCLLAAFPIEAIYQTLAGRSAAGDLAAAGLEDPKQTYRQAFDRLKGGAPVPPRAFASAEASEGAKLTPADYYAYVGVPVSNAAEAILSVADLTQILVGLSQAGPGGTAPTGRGNRRTIIEVVLALVDVVGVGMSFPIGTDIEVEVQRGAWGVHLGAGLLLPFAKRLLPPQAYAAMDMMFGAAEYMLSLSVFIAEMADTRTSPQARQDVGQNIGKMAGNHLHWVSRGLTDAAEFDAEPETKAVFAAFAVGALEFALWAQAGRIGQGISEGRELQRF
jgi:hypothetical protein